VSLLRDEFDRPARWAVALAVAETARHVGAVLEHGPSLAGGERVRHLHRASALVEHVGAVEPPLAAHAVILDRPLPHVVLPAGLPGHQIALEASAALVHFTAVGSAEFPPMISEVLAVSIAAETACRYAAALPIHLPGVKPMPGQAAASGWRSLRAALEPFDDGSRRQQSDRPAVVAWAVRLCDALRRDLGPLPVDAEEWRRRPDAHELAVNLRAAVNYLPAVAHNVDSAARSWGATGRVMAYATDLYRREDRVEQWLAGHHPRGMVHVDGRELTPVLRATRDAGTLSAKLGDEIARVIRPAARAPDAHIAAAAQERFSGAEQAWRAQRAAVRAQQLAATRGRPIAHSRGR